MPGIDEYTKLMLHMDGADASTTFTDSEITPKTFTTNGGAQIDTAQSKFGGASGLFNGTNAYITTPNSSDFDFGLGDFTIDAWVRPITNPAPSGYSGIISADSSLSSTGWNIWMNSSRILRFANFDGGVEYLASSALSADTWTHFAVVRNGTGASGLTLYINGTSVDTYTGNVTINSEGVGLALGRFYVSTFNGHYYQGHIDEVRISKGIARWTANFTPPASAYSADSTTPSSSTLGLSGIIQ